ncbi:solute carrier family 35 member G1-like [Limulus polyphemus]|uniref:Solute carrier family 35 member G1-like n=1 Tax=Limulus polyphemus TaxID=6850 RepID=A0ABM1C4P5_LIMPO|nr:solute carrier family 35 member G1-like [Limulus polyphemus]
MVAPRLPRRREQENDTQNISSIASESTPLLATQPQKGWLERFKRLPGPGIICAALSGLFFSIGSLTVKLIPSMNPLEIVFFGAIIQTVIFISINIQSRRSILGASGERFFLLMRGISGVVCANLVYYSYRLIPLADATTIVFSAPIFVAIFACMLLKETCNLFFIITVITTISGVIFISKPPFLFDSDQENVSSSNRIIGISLAFGGCLSFALVYLFMRKLQRSHYSSITLVFSVLVVIVNPILLTLSDSWSIPGCERDGWLLVLLGFAVVGAQISQIFALKTENEGPVSVARSSEVFMAFIFQASILEEKVEWTSTVGGILVCSGIGLFGWRQWKKDKLYHRRNM